ncbi:MAG: FAD-dependent oxidoreductase, partial [Luteitalea sp.]
VVVVGGGLAGLTAAYLLTTAGKRVAVLERDRCGQIDTGSTTAHLTMVTDTLLSELVARFGRDHAQAAWDAGLAAIEQVASIVHERRIDCAFARVDGYLHAPRVPTVEPPDFEAQARLARDLGFDATYQLEVPGLGRPGVRYADQARFQPLQYLAGLAEAIVAGGGRIHEQSAVETFSTDPLRVDVNGVTLTCDDIVLATHNPLVGVSGTISASVFQTKLALYTSYVVAGRVPRGTLPDALFWDTNDPYDYVRVQPDGNDDLVIYGGEDHKTGQEATTHQHHDRLQQRLAALVPGVVVTHRWSGQVIETPDGLPYIGPSADHQYVATGFAGNGMTFGTLGAMLISDAILGRRNPWAELFEPGRSALRHAAWEYLKENADYPYYMLRQRIAGAPRSSIDTIARGQGQVVERDGQKIAAYRADDGAVTMRSAVCPHLGCLVGWNDAERTWDCPCHGSRFTPEGAVIAGPAESPLAEAE